jgi:hypothetical protein
LRITRYTTCLIATTCVDYTKHSSVTISNNIFETILCPESFPYCTSTYDSINSVTFVDCGVGSTTAATQTSGKTLRPTFFPGSTLTPLSTTWQRLVLRQTSSISFSLLPPPTTFPFIPHFTDDSEEGRETDTVTDGTTVLNSSTGVASTTVSVDATSTSTVTVQSPTDVSNSAAERVMRTGWGGVGLSVALIMMILA